MNEEEWLIARGVRRAACVYLVVFLAYAECGVRGVLVVFLGEPVARTVTEEDGGNRIFQDKEVAEGRNWSQSGGIGDGKERNDEPTRQTKTAGARVIMKADDSGRR